MSTEWDDRLTRKIITKIDDTVNGLLGMLKESFIGGALGLSNDASASAMSSGAERISIDERPSSSVEAVGKRHQQELSLMGPEKSPEAALGAARANIDQALHKSHVADQFIQYVENQGLKIGHQAEAVPLQISPDATPSAAKDMARSAGMGMARSLAH